MNATTRKLLRLLAVLLALFAFTGDLVADSISDAFGDTVAESGSHQNDDGATACAIHCGTAVVCEVRVLSEIRFVPLRNLKMEDENGAEGVPAPIDVPPQLGR